MSLEHGYCTCSGRLDHVDEVIDVGMIVEGAVRDEDHSRVAYLDVCARYDGEAEQPILGVELRVRNWHVFELAGQSAAALGVL